MHEIGHNLGLRHGGNVDVNCKPNYLSVMSYSFQFANLVGTRPLDYSRSVLGTLDESHLNEGYGVSAGPSCRTKDCLRPSPHFDCTELQDSPLIGIEMDIIMILMLVQILINWGT